MSFCLWACYRVPLLCGHRNEHPREMHTQTHLEVAAVIKWGASCPLGAATAITHRTFGGTRLCLFPLSDDPHLPSLRLHYSTAVLFTPWLYIPVACQRTPVVKVKTWLYPDCKWGRMQVSHLLYLSCSLFSLIRTLLHWSLLLLDGNGPEHLDCCCGRTNRMLWGCCSWERAQQL